MSFITQEELYRQFAEPSTLRFHICKMAGRTAHQVAGVLAVQVSNGEDPYRKLIPPIYENADTFDPSIELLEKVSQRATRYAVGLIVASRVSPQEENDPEYRMPAPAQLRHYVELSGRNPQAIGGSVILKNGLAPSHLRTAVLTLFRLRENQPFRPKHIDTLSDDASAKKITRALSLAHIATTQVEFACSTMQPLADPEKAIGRLYG